MDRVASLQNRSSAVIRQIFASLSPQIRLAFVFDKLADSSLRMLGRSLGAVFILKDVEGLPPVNGKEAAQLKAELGGDLNRIMAKLPPNYLEEFAGGLRRMLFRQFHHNESFVADLISGWLLRFVMMGGWKGMQEGLNLSRVRNYVLTGLQREGLNMIQKQKRKREDVSLQETDDEGHTKMNPSDPNALKDFYEEVMDRAPWKMPSVRRILEQKAHPDAALFLDLLYEGYDQKEIVQGQAGGEGSMLPHLREHPMSYQNWLKTYNPKILRVLQDVVQV